jgi:hypothetical protein
MKTSLLAALFLFACLFFASALAQRGQEDEGTAEVDPELAELNAFFKNLIPGSDTSTLPPSPTELLLGGDEGLSFRAALDADQLSQINTALGRSGPRSDGSKIIEVNINLKLLLIKLAHGGYGLYNDRD